MLTANGYTGQASTRVMVHSHLSGGEAVSTLLGWVKSNHFHLGGEACIFGKHIRMQA